MLAIEIHWDPLRSIVACRLCLALLWLLPINGWAMWVLELGHYCQRWNSINCQTLLWCFSLVLPRFFKRYTGNWDLSLRSVFLPFFLPPFLSVRLSIIVWKSFLTNLALFPLYLLKTSPPINTHTSLLAPTTWGTFFGTCMPTKITCHGRENVIRYENPTVFY